MKLRVIATLVAVLSLGFGTASAQTIGCFADQSGGSCNIPLVYGFQGGTFYVLGLMGGAVTGMTVAEGAIIVDRSLADGGDGVPGTHDGFDGNMSLTITPNPDANVATANPFGAGFEIAFPTCQAGPAVLLYTVDTANFSVPPEHTLTVQAKNPPNNPNFDCSLFAQCDTPFFTKVCVPGGSAFINSQTNCTVAVAQETWSGVKNLFRY